MWHNPVLFSCYFFRFRKEIFSFLYSIFTVNPPLGDFMHVFFSFENLTFKFYKIYTHLKHLLFNFQLLSTTSEKILDKIFGYDFTLKKPADRIFRHILTDDTQCEMTAENSNYLIMMTTRSNKLMHVMSKQKISSSAPQRR